MDWYKKAKSIQENDSKDNLTLQLNSIVSSFRRFGGDGFPHFNKMNKSAIVFFNPSEMPPENIDKTISEIESIETEWSISIESY
jgi:hypothetical protein